jgi:hypothetical protein
LLEADELVEGISPFLGTAAAVCLGRAVADWQGLGACGAVACLSFGAADRGGVEGGSWHVFTLKRYVTKSGWSPVINAPGVPLR